MMSRKKRQRQRQRFQSHDEQAVKRRDAVIGVLYYGSLGARLEINVHMGEITMELSSAGGWYVGTQS
jgi:hypothetical protein